MESGMHTGIIEMGPLGGIKVEGGGDLVMP